MNLATKIKGVAACLAAVTVFAQAATASAYSYCAQFGGTFSNSQLTCPGSAQGGQLPGDENTEGWGQGRTSSGVKQVRVNLYHYAYDYDYIAAYVYGINSSGDFVTTCHAITYDPGITPYDNCPSSAVSYNLYIYAD